MPDPDNNREIKHPLTGDFTRIMTPDEYRAWVRQSVTGEIWRKLLTGLSFFGLATIFAIGGTTFSIMDSRIGLQISQQRKDVIDPELKKQQDTLNSAIAQQKDSLVPTINKELDRQVETHKLVEAITKSAVAQLRKGNALEEELRKLIVSQSQQTLADASQSQKSLRQLALQQILLFGDPSQRSDAINGVLRNLKSEAGEFDIAVQFFEPHPKGGDALLWQNILSRVNVLSDKGWAAISKTLENAVYREEALFWIRRTSSGQRQVLGESIQTLIRHIAEVPDLAVAERFIEWTESKDPAFFELGVQGLTYLTPQIANTNAAKRHQLIDRAVTTLSTFDTETDGLSDYLSRLHAALRQQDIDELRSYAASEFATPAIKSLVGALTDSRERSESARDTRRENRAPWAIVERIATIEALRQHGQYPPEAPVARAIKALAPLLDIRAGSDDWKTLVQEKASRAGERWSSNRRLRLVVNTWVYRLQNAPGVSESQSSPVAELFIEAHSKNDASVLLSENFASYQYLMSMAHETVLRKFFENVIPTIGRTERSSAISLLRSEHETTILAAAFNRSLQKLASTKDLLTLIRTSAKESNENPDRILPGRRMQIWFAAAARTAGMKEVTLRTVDHSRILAFLRDRVKPEQQKTTDERLTPTGATALLYILTNPTYLAIDSVQRNIELANLHLLRRDNDNLDMESFASELATSISNETSGVLGWVGKLQDLATSIKGGDSKIQLSDNNDQWLAFELPPKTRVAQFQIQSTILPNYLLVGESDRVLKAGRAQRKSAKLPAEINVITNPGLHFLRLNPGRGGSALTVGLTYLDHFPPGILSRRGDQIVDIRPNDPITIGTSGNDQAWLRLHAKQDSTYYLRTFNLRSNRPDIKGQRGVDTEIEVFDSTESYREEYDDDGAHSSERWASRLVLSPRRANVTYHIRLGNISSDGGSFDFEVIEKAK